jgi:hypothetical protein
MSAKENTETEIPATLVEALIAFQKDPPTISKNKQGQAGNRIYKYADLGEILPIVNPRLAALGLYWSSKVGRDETGELVLKFRLMHVSGEADEGEIPLGVPRNCKPQELGSAQTYARRYAITAQLNLATEDDDDAQAAQSASRQQPTAAPAQPTERVVSAKQKGMIYGHAKALSASTLANAILETTGSDLREWDSEDAALSWLNRSMERLPAKYVDGLLAVVEREVEKLSKERAEEEPTMSMVPEEAS